MSFPAEIQNRIAAQGITTLVHVGSKATLPQTGKVIHLLEYGGPGPWRTHNTGAAPSYVRPSFQIVTHADDLADARALMLSVRDAITIRDTYLDGTWYLYVEPNGDPRDSGLDGNDRATFTLNFNTLKRPS